MAIQHRKSWLRRRVENGLRRGFQHAYETVKVDPNKFLLQLRTAYGVPINSFQGIYSVDVGILDDLANEVIRSGMKLAAAEGAGFGLGGILTIVPDLSILAGITLRTIQKLSLIYGFEYNTDEETAEGYDVQFSSWHFRCLLIVAYEGRADGPRTANHEPRTGNWFF